MNTSGVTNGQRHVTPDSNSVASWGRGFSDSGPGSFRSGWVIWIWIRVRLGTQIEFRPLEWNENMKRIEQRENIAAFLKLYMGDRNLSKAQL
jgi:hypothetical protein